MPCSFQIPADQAVGARAAIQTARILTAPDTKPHGRRSTRVKCLARAIVYIEDRFREPLSLEAIAGAACMSRFHFARIFRDEIGMSPMQYVRWRRVIEAERRLAAGEESLLKLAGDLGYFDHSHFSRSFKAATGVMPKQYAATTLDGSVAA